MTAEHGQVQRPIVNDDHIVITCKINVDWRKVPMERRVQFITRMETIVQQEFEYLLGMEEQ